MNDLSAHPAPTGPDPNALATNNSVILNTLADLTNRENRFAYQRFANDFQNLAGDRRPDNLADDFNGDNVPDYYPTLYNGVLTAYDSVQGQQDSSSSLLPPRLRTLRSLMAFPYVFPGAYSVSPGTLE